MKRLIGISLAAMTLLGASRIPAIHSLKPGDAEKLLAGGGVMLLDVRTPAEYQTGHLQGARLFPIVGFSKRLRAFPFDKTQLIVVYCSDGGRSTKGAKVLAEYGYKDIYILSGGIQAWVAQQKPIEKASR